jgi:pimeloyl-ACP methyl ester carboxylesterase
MHENSSNSRPTGLFLPGWAAPARLYRAGIPEGWDALELPSFRRTRGELAAYREWIADVLDEVEEPVALAGHSMGGALALLGAVDRPQRVARLILVSPAGLPLTKPIPSSLATFVRQLATGRYPVAHAVRSIARVVLAPRSALRLGRVVHQLDLRPELDRLHLAAAVVGCATDTMTPASLCRELAALIEADYREVDASDGHIWPITHPELLRAELSR